MSKHIKVNGCLLQINKQWRDLKRKQKQLILELARHEYEQFLRTHEKLPTHNSKEQLINKVYDLIEAQKIWIPYGEVYRVLCSLIAKWNRKQERIEQERLERSEFLEDNIEKISKALERLKAGNEKYLMENANIGNTSQQLREQTAKDGQVPYAVIITCSDSRVIPESIFSAGIGELFVIRSAGFTIDNTAMGSIEYAVVHLGVPLIVVMGHTHCGAVDTAMKHEIISGKLRLIIREISKVIGKETNPYIAVKLNVKNGCEIIESAKLPAMTVGAVYHIDSGRVEFL